MYGVAVLDDVILWAEVKLYLEKIGLKGLRKRLIKYLAIFGSTEVEWVTLNVKWVFFFGSIPIISAT